MEVRTSKFETIPGTILYGPIVSNDRFQLVIKFESAAFDGRTCSFLLQPHPWHSSDEAVQIIQRQFKEIKAEFGWILSKDVEGDLLCINWNLGKKLTKEMGRHLVDQLYYVILENQKTD